MNFNLLAAFRGARERRAKDKALEAACVKAIEAIQQSRMDDFKAVYAAQNFNFDQNKRILCAAIIQDNVEIFDIVLNKAFKGDTNYVLGFRMDAGPEGPYHLDYYPVLSYALMHKAHAVALRVAKAPETDVSQIGNSTNIGSSGGGYFTPGHSKTTEREHDHPLEIAHHGGNQEVIAVIADRLADQHQQKANLLRQGVFPAVAKASPGAFLGLR